VSDFGRRIRPHKTSHQDGGSDEISVEGLAGDLFATQEPDAHGMGGLKHIASLLSLVNSKITDANLDDKNDPRTPSAHKTSHQSGGADALACTGLVGRVNYVNRGDPATYDKAVGDFTTDQTWRDLDLSLIVPAGATVVHVKVSLQATTVGDVFILRAKGHNNAVNALGGDCQVANIHFYCFGFVPLDANRVVQYYGTTTTFTTISLLVQGWFI